MVNTEIRLILFFAAKDGEVLYSQQKQDQELTVAHIMNSLLPNSDLNWGKWGKPLPFRYDLSEIPDDCRVEVKNSFKGLELIECLMNYGQRFVTLYRRQGARPSQRKKKKEMHTKRFSSKEQAFLNFMTAVTICSDFGAPEIKFVTVSTVSPSMCYEVMGLDAMVLVFWMLSFKPTFSLSSFTFIKRLFSSSSLFAVRVVSSAHLRLLIFLLLILVPACASSSLAIYLMYSAYKWNKQGDNV